MRAALTFWMTLVFVTSAAWAEEKPIPLADQLAAARKAGDPAAWIELLEAVPSVYAPADDTTRKKLMKRMGDALKSDAKDVAPTTLRLLVKIGDGEVAWREALRHVVPDRKKEQISPFDMEVFGTIYALRPDGAIDTLLTLVRKAKSPDVAAWSMRALGGYERSAKRVEVLDALGKTLIASAPGKKKGGDGGPRWKAMRPFVAQTLNNLTGQKADIKTWGQLWFAHRKKPEALFVRPLPK